MLESRASYGWSRSTGVTSKDTLKKYQVCYRTDDGGFGEIGYQLFDTKEQATTFGEKFRNENSWVTEIIIRHPSKIYSNY